MKKICNDMCGKGCSKNNALLKLLAFIGIIAAIVGVVLVIIKCCYPSCDDFDFDDKFDDFEGECDENGCYYTNEEDFEKE